METSARPLWYAGFIAAGLSVIVLLYVFNPSESRVFPPCPFHALTGWHCPGCGSLRAVHQLLHGDVAGAFRLNPLMVLFLPFMVYGIAAEISGGMLKKRLPAVRLGAWWIRAILAVIVMYGIVRNLPFAPFEALAP